MGNVTQRHNVPSKYYEDLLNLVIDPSKYYEQISVPLCILDKTKLENVYYFNSPKILDLYASYLFYS